jgi:hypothetical protein
MRSKHTMRSLTAVATLVLLGTAACKERDTTDTVPPAPGAQVPRDTEQAVPRMDRQGPTGATDPSSPNRGA